MNNRQQYHLLLSYVGARQHVLVEQLLQKGVSPNCDEKDIDSCLQVATDNEDLPMLRLLVQYKADATKTNSNGDTPLDVACNKGNWEIVEFFLIEDKGRHINIAQKVLDAAIKAKKVNIIQSLLERGVSPNSKEDNVDSCLHIAVDQKISTDIDKQIVKLLLDHGAFMAKVGKGGDTPIRMTNFDMAEYIASIRHTGKEDNAWFWVKMLDAINENNQNYLRIVKTLLYSGARADKCYSNSKQNGLHLAVERNNPELIRLLRRFGANVDQQDINNQTASDLARIKKYWNVLGALAEPIPSGEQVYNYLTKDEKITGVEVMPEMKKLAEDYKEAVFVHMMRMPEDERLKALEVACDEKTKLSSLFRQHRSLFAFDFAKVSEDKGVFGKIKCELTRLQKKEAEKEEKNKALSLNS